MNRDRVRTLMQLATAAGQGGTAFDPDGPMDDGNPLGTPEAEIHWQVDVTNYVDHKRAALEAHQSQASDIQGFLSMPPEMFTTFFGWEHFIEPGRAAGIGDYSPLARTRTMVPGSRCPLPKPASASAFGWASGR